MSKPEQPAPTTPPETVALWAEYAKDQYEAAEEKVGEFRGWARQLAVAIGVIISVDLTMATKLFDMTPPYDRNLYGACLLLLVFSVASETVLLFLSFGLGYLGKSVNGPESPAVVADQVLAKPPEEAKRLIGAYYNQAQKEMYALRETVIKRVGAVAKFFRWSLLLPILAFALFAALRWTRHEEGGYNLVPMADSPKPPTPTPAQPSRPAPAEKAPSPPPANPLLRTPTKGQPITEGDKGKGRP